MRPEQLVDGARGERLEAVAALVGEVSVGAQSIAKDDEARAVTRSPVGVNPVVLALPQVVTTSICKWEQNYTPSVDHARRPAAASILPYQQRTKLNCSDGTETLVAVQGAAYENVGEGG